MASQISQGWCKIDGHNLPKTRKGFKKALEYQRPWAYRDNATYYKVYFWYKFKLRVDQSKWWMIIDFLVYAGNHFLLNLFPGLDEYPPTYGAESPDNFDEHLPPIQASDIEFLKETVPELTPRLKQVLTSCYWVQMFYNWIWCVVIYVCEMLYWNIMCIFVV